jgi:hypothetical protein
VPSCVGLGAAFAVLDAATTWYALQVLHAEEGNPVVRWAIAHYGLPYALGLRVFVGCVALGLVAVGVTLRLRHHQQLVNCSCRVLLMTGLVLWGVVAVSNTVQVVWLRVA